MQLSVFLPSYLPAVWNAHVMTRTLVALFDLGVKSHAEDDGVTTQKEPEALMAMKEAALLVPTARLWMCFT